MEAVLPGYDGDDGDCSTWVGWRLFYLGRMEAVLPEYDGDCSTWVGWRLFYQGRMEAVLPR